MKQILLFFITALLCWLQFGFAQTPASVAEKQDPIQDSIDKYKKSGQLAKVVPFAEQWAETCKRKNGEESAAYGAALNKQGDVLIRSGKSKEAEPILLQGFEINTKALGEDHPEVARSLYSLGVVHMNMGNFPKSEPYLLKSLEIRKKTFGETHLDVATSLNGLGILNMNMGNYPKAEQYFLKALEIRKKVKGSTPSEVTSSLETLGVLYMKMGNLSQAEPYLFEALEIRKKAFGEDHPDVATSFHNLGSLNFEIANYPKAERYMRKVLEIKKRKLGENHPEVASALNNIGLIYLSMGNYPKAETSYLKALEIFKKELGEDHPDLALSLSNLGLSYYEMGNYEKARPVYLKALEIQKKALGEDHPDLGYALLGISNLYFFMDNYPESEKYLLKSLEILRKSLGDDNPKVALQLNNLGNLYSTMGNYAKSETFYLKALEIRTKALGENHPDVALSLKSLGRLHHNMGNYLKAETYYLKTLEISKRALGADHPQTAQTIADFGLLYFNRGHWDKSESYFLDWNAKKQAQIQQYFPILSDNEKKQFYENKLSASQEEFKSFCINRYASKKVIGTHMYNNQLSTKALLLSNSLKFKQRLRTSKDSLLQAKFENWEGLTNRISKLYSSTDSSEIDQLKQLETKAEALEKELVRKSEDFATLSDKKQHKWTDVQKKLKPGEAAIEMVRVWKSGINKIVIDTSDPKKTTYRIKGLSDTVYYAALIVKPRSKYPEMVLLENGNALEQRWIQVYKNSMKAKVQDQTSYNQFWKKIDAKLGPAVNRVYFSPDGVYNSINLNTLQNPKTGKYLLDERDIRLVTNTKDIVTANISKPNPAYACLVGFPDYNTDKEKRVAIFRGERSSPDYGYNLNLTRSDAFAELPATKTEIENISRLMQTNGWQVESLMGETALEESIKSVQKPKVLHIATHGFFQPDTTKGSNLLVHSGLLLTGANKTIAGEKVDKVDDGILTAYEAMNLNLDNTDLVVLSACETGLGEIKNGEGVYGLQRAFKVAGARSIIMSLWKVDDEATQELMVSFYKHWLGGTASDKTQPSSRLNKRSAFLKAQKELKAKYLDPYYWGAFVMVGE